MKSLFLFSFFVLGSLSVACKPETDYCKDLPRKEKAIISDILKVNGIKNTTSTRNQVAIVADRQSDAGSKAVLDRLRIHSSIVRLPPTVGELSDLRFIEITGSMEKPRMPEGLGYLKPVRGMLITERTIDSSFNAPLRHLDLEHLAILKCRFKGFPGQVFALPKLRFLSLSNDSLTELQPDVCKLKKLQNLWIDGNMLKNLPSSLSANQQLLSVYLQNNLFESFPLELTSIEGLNELDISNNRIRDLPEGMLKLSNLKPGIGFLDGAGGGSSRTFYRLKIDGNRICHTSPTVSAYLDTFAGKWWRDSQKCE